MKNEKKIFASSFKDFQGLILVALLVSSFFTEHVVSIWNSLPAGTDFSSLSGFILQKNSMDFIEIRSISFYVLL